MNSEIVTITLDSIKEIDKLNSPNIGEKIVTLDITNISNKEDRVRILDLTAGLVLGKNCTIRKINDDGVYLINPPKN